MGYSFEVKPHVYDPVTNPELFEGVLARRVVAFIIDVIIIAVPLIAAWIFIFVLGVLTLGLGWALFWLLSPASVIWALFYYGYTLGSSASAAASSPRPAMKIWPMWLTSNRLADCRVQQCSAMMPSYWTGI